MWSVLCVHCHYRKHFRFYFQLKHSTHTHTHDSLRMNFSMFAQLLIFILRAARTVYNTVLHCMWNGSKRQRCRVTKLHLQTNVNDKSTILKCFWFDSPLSHMQEFILGFWPGDDDDDDDADDEESKLAPLAWAHIFYSLFVRLLLIVH